MGWGKIKKSLGAVSRALPGGKSSIVADARKIVSLGIVDSDAARRQEKNISGANTEAEKQAAAASEQARLKALADESVRQQEELARRKTIFAGESIDTQNQRKTLLGL